MSENLDQPSSTAIPAEERQLLIGVEPRIFRATLILGLIGAAGFWIWQGAGWAAGFSIGAALSAVSFHWMKGAVNKLADTILASDADSRPRGSAGAVSRFILRYGLIGIAGYVIFRSSVISLVAFFAGLFVSIVAVLIEIGYQIYLGFRRT
jgi:ATP synthase I chain